MRLTDGEDRPLSYVYVGLTDDEARELRDALDNLLANPATHVHVSSADFQNEISVFRLDS